MIVNFLGRLLLGKQIEALEKVERESRLSKRKKLLQYLSALLFILGTGVLFTMAVVNLIDAFWPHLNRPHQPSLLELVVVFPAILGSLFLGLIVGAAISVVFVGLFLSKSEMQNMTQPETPVLSDSLRWLIDKTARDKPLGYDG